MTGDGGAVKDLLAAFTLSRHCNSNGSTISLLVRISIQQFLAEGAADMLKRLDQDHLRRLADGLAMLPTACGAREALLSESEDMFGWWADRLRSDGIKAAEEFLKKLPQEEGTAKAPAKEPVTAEDVPRYVHDLEIAQRYFALAAGMSALPPAEFEAQSLALAAGMKKECTALPELFADPVAAKIRYQEARSDDYMTLLKAAIAVVLDGPDRLKSFRDPFGDGPFEYSAVGTGFQLKSKLVYAGKPTELTVPGL